MKKHVRDRVSLAAAVVAVVAIAAVALVATTSDEGDPAPGTDLVLPSPTDVPTPSPAPALLGSPAPLDPGPPQRPKPGTYRYRTRPRDPKDPDRAFEVRIVNQGSNGQKEYLDGGRVNDSVWRSDGKYLLQVMFGQPEGILCDWEPDARDLAFPLEVGQWESRSSCSPYPGLVMERAATSEVTGAAQVLIGGKDVVVWVIRINSSLRFRFGEEVFDQQEVSRVLFSPRHGLVVRLTQRRTGKDPASSKEIDEARTLELISLDPT